MDSGLRPVSHAGNKNLDWLTVVLFLSDRSFYDARKVNKWEAQFEKLIVAGKGKAPKRLAENVQWYSCDPEEGRAEVWNKIARNVETSWILFLEDDEQLQVGSIPEPQNIGIDQWAPVVIKRQKEATEHQYYQMRLINTDITKDKIFRGHDLVDATHYVRSNDIELTNMPLIVERESQPFTSVDIDRELSLKGQPAKLYLVQGKRDLDENKYVRASAQYRQLLKKEKLLPFDRLAAVNGLASCLAEQHKWQKALALTQKSLDAESLQALPYLIQFRIYELRKEWEKAYKALKQYHERQSLFSRASFDRLIDEEKTLVNLANIALKAGKRAKATDYFEKLFTFKRGNADQRMLEKALLLSIELGDRKRSIYLFERVYGDCLPPNEMDANYREEVDEVMSMFMKQKWYDYVSGIYNKLHNSYPEDPEYKRKLIVTLTKTNRLDQAKKMVANIV